MENGVIGQEESGWGGRNKKNCIISKKKRDDKKDIVVRGVPVPSNETHKGRDWITNIAYPTFKALIERGNVRK